MWNYLSFNSKDKAILVNPSSVLNRLINLFQITMSSAKNNCVAQSIDDYLKPYRFISLLNKIVQRNVCISYISDFLCRLFSVREL